MTALAQTTEAETQLAPVDPYISMIERVAMDPEADLEKLERMLALKKDHDAQQAEAAFAAAFAAASSEFPAIPLNGKGHNGIKYALLKDIVSHTRPVLSKHGLALNWDCKVDQNLVTVTAKLSHKLGHSESTSIALPTDGSGSKNAVQAIGSSQTYGQRYTGQAILGLSLGDDVEDDGRGAGKPIKEPEKYPSWAQTVTQDMPASATPRDKAEAIADALCAQWNRKNTMKQLDNEWDRREEILQSLEEKHPDLHEKVCEAYDVRAFDLRGGA